ncbi:MAG: hypothetical protein AAB848_02630 [Patescibacteria group bacterium]
MARAERECHKGFVSEQGDRRGGDGTLVEISGGVGEAGVDSTGNSMAARGEGGLLEVISDGVAGTREACRKFSAAESDGGPNGC